MRLMMFPVTALFLALLLSGCGSSKSEDASTTPANANDVTLSGSMQLGGSQPASVQTAGASTPLALSSNPADYTLYCVTFTVPTHSGSGAFDATGAFSVTLTEAAGLPVGCFINDTATNQPVSTLTFTVGAASGLSDGTSPSASLTGGTHAVTINFDPTTGVATADVSTAVEAGAAATFNPADLVGSWNMACADAADANCSTFLGGAGMPVYLDVITALEGTETVYAMGAWKGRQEFIDAGATEGLYAGNLPANITGVTSLNTDVATPTPTALGTFTGFVAQTGYDPATNILSGDNVIAALTALSLAYDATFDDTMGDYCTSPTLTLTNQNDRYCLLEYLESISGEQATGNALTIPRVDSRAWNDFGNSGVDGTSLIPFRTSLGDSPDIGARYALMDLEVEGASAIASDHWQDNYTGWDEVNNVQVSCTHAGELTIIITITGTNTATGRFTQKEFDSCSGGAGQYSTFEVNFTK